MIKVEAKLTRKAKPDYNNLGFGKYFTDHMFVMDYDEKSGWNNPRVIPYQNFECDPSMLVFHYGQSLFEGMKAYRNAQDEVRLFRPFENFKRMNEGAKRMCIPNFDADVVYEGLKILLELDKEWIPTKYEQSLYIRPTIIATENLLGVKASSKYIFYIICSPVAAYYSSGLSPVKIFVEEEYTRAAIGGTGAVKCGGNYAASLIGSEKAKKLGFSQVLWLDSKEKKYVEEVGAMNMFFVVDNEVITPALNGSILPGITRKSVIELLKSEGIKVTERQISIDEIQKASKSGSLKECFGTGTAAVISPVGLLHYKGNDMIINNQKIGKITLMLYDKITKIQVGEYEDKFGWSVKL